MKHFIYIIGACFLFVGICSAQTQKQSVYQRILSNTSAIENNVYSLAFQNPSMKYMLHKSILTEISIGGQYQNENKPSIIQEGDGNYFGTVDVNSFIHKKNSSIWGQANYMNGKKTGRCWNETSDYSLLYPYVMGDTLGGSLKSEQYYFAGGYAYNTSKYIIGVEGSYKAEIEYRHADPRPKNLTGDLNVKLGLSRLLNNSYWLGLAFYARKYKQTNDLVFYNELGVPNIYHFTGLGTDYNRFRGAKGKSFYKGHSFGGSLDLLPTDNGLSAAIHYTNFTFDKVVASLNELPMAKVNEDKINSEIAWKSTTSSRHQWGVKGALDYTRRIGTENIFGMASGNIFPQIGSDKKYMNKIYSGKINAVYEYRNSRDFRMSIIPQIIYTDIKTQYLYPHQEMNISFVSSGFDIQASFPLRKWMFSGIIGTNFRIKTLSDLLIESIAENELDKKLNEPVVNNYEALKSNNSNIHTNIRVDYAWDRKHSIFFALNYNYVKSQRPSEMQYIKGQIGLSF